MPLNTSKPVTGRTTQGPLKIKFSFNRDKQTAEVTEASIPTTEEVSLIFLLGNLESNGRSSKRLSFNEKSDLPYKIQGIPL